MVYIPLDKEMKTKMFISELCERKILTRTANAYKYGDDIIANSNPECVEYLNDPKNQSIRLALETKLKKIASVPYINEDCEIMFYQKI